jgi:aldehyde dehydrogenase (NAD+)
VVTAGNFPVAVPSWYVIPALVTGNTVVWKPAEYAAASAMALFELIQAAGLPDGVMNIVFADGPATFGGLEQALRAGTLDKIGFTGSTAVGDLELAVEGALFSGFGTAGQRCTSLGTVIVHESVHDEFLAQFAAAVSAAAVGDPAQDVLYGPMLDQKFADRFEEYLGWIQPHHKVLGSSAVGRITGASPRAGFVGDPEAGIFYHPTIADGVQPDDDLFRQETFGPIVSVTTYTGFDEAITLANAPGYGLSASIYTNNPREVFGFRRGISAGMVSVNNSTSGAEAHLPFGGNGKSGNGSRQSGVWVLDQFTRWQSMNWDYSGRLQKAQMDVAEITADLDFRLED